MIYMFMTPGKVQVGLLPHQDIIQLILLCLLPICMLTMIFAKPLILLYRHNHRSAYTSALPVAHTDSESSEDDPRLGGANHGHGHGGAGEEFQFSEIMVHQALESVEFLLGTVSHTASYLRLWALSLAHSELATVLWNKAFFEPISLAGKIEVFGYAGQLLIGGVLAFVGFTFWFFFTLGIILFMESLASFLHALRLHWIEFQSKFYKGDGKLFKPFAYQRVLAGEEMD